MQLFIKKTDISDSLFTLSGVPIIYRCDCIAALLEAYGVNRGRLNVSCCFSLHFIKPTQSGRVDCGDWTVAVLSIYPPSSARTWFVISLNVPKIFCGTHTHTLHRYEKARVRVSVWLIVIRAIYPLYCKNPGDGSCSLVIRYEPWSEDYAHGLRTKDQHTSQNRSAGLHVGVTLLRIFRDICAAHTHTHMRAHTLRSKQSAPPFGV